MVKLKHLTVHRYRNIEPETSLTFGDGINVLLGLNGAGKTTLLKLISAVLRSDFRQLGGDFHLSFRLEFPEGSVDAVVRGEKQEPALSTPEGPREEQYPRTTVEADIRLHDGLTVRVEPKGDAYVVHDPEGDRPLFFVDRIVSGHIYGFVVSARRPREGQVPILLPLGAPFRFDESLDMFRGLIGDLGALPPGLDVALPAPHFLVRSDKSGVQLMGAGGFISSIWSTLAAALPRQGEVREVLLPPGEPGFMADVVRIAGFHSGRIAIGLIKKDVDGDSEYTHLGPPRFWFKRRDGSEVSQDALSYGQQRLLTFFYYLGGQPSFVIADELVNGFHHEWIEECVKAIGQRQAFLTSQNPLLLDCLFFESMQEVKQSFVLCQNRSQDGREQLRWRNFSDDEADMFYRAYQTGVQHVGEILRTKGLW